jgi:polysaccharide biosynthesis/export protein
MMEQTMIRVSRKIARWSGLGVAVFLLSSLSLAGAQQSTAASALAPGVATKPASTPAALPEVSKAPLNDYTVSPEDLLDVFILDVPEVTRTYRVSSNGFLTLPLLPEPVLAAGQSLDQLSHLIATKYHDAGMLSDAQVTVQLKETRLHTVLVSGEVKKPEAYTVYGPTRLLDLLIQAGGLVEDAGNDAVILRGEIGARADLEEIARTGGVDRSAKGLSFTLNIRKLVETGDDPANNILVYPGDKVTVQRADLIYILGAVNRPGGYVLNESRKQVTVLKALAMAGDVNNVAKRSAITIMRHDPAEPEDKRSQIPVDYKAMIRGKIADIRLKPDDILFVPESGKIKAMRTTVNTAVTMATYAGGSMIIYH